MTIERLKLHEEIDWSMFCLSMLHDQYRKRTKPKSVIELMVDKATGYALEKDRETTKTALYHFRRIVKYKKLLNEKFGTDYSTENSEKGIVELLAVLKTLKPHALQPQSAHLRSPRNPHSQKKGSKD